GRLIDAVSGAPVAEGIVTVGERETRLGAQGSFHVRGTPTRVAFRAPGYRQTSMARTDLEHAGGVVRLEPFLPKALYLTVYGVGSEKLLGRALS
ncbi:hypothetical protein ABTI01_19830, partial [Acinetobacter baumannii]